LKSRSSQINLVTALIWDQHPREHPITGQLHAIAGQVLSEHKFGSLMQQANNCFPMLKSSEAGVLAKINHQKIVASVNAIFNEVEPPAPPK